MIKTSRQMIRVWHTNRRYGDAGHPCLQRHIFLIALTLVLLSMSGCAFGGDGEEEVDPFQEKVSALRTTQAKLPIQSKDSGASPTPVVKNDKDARELVWAHLSLCAKVDARSLTTVEVKGDWFVQTTGSAPPNSGIWKVDPATGSLEPYDALARSWNSFVKSQCDPEIQSTLMTRTPIPTVTLTVSDAGKAEVAVWAHLVKCDSSLTTREFESNWNSLSRNWVVTSSNNTQMNYGVWSLDGDTAELLPNDQMSSWWDEYISSGCNHDVLAEFTTPTPSASPTPAIQSSSDAVNAVWSHLVRCFPELPIQTLEAKWNPSEGTWIVITKPDVQINYGVWNVSVDAEVHAWNRESESREEVVAAGNC